MRARAKRGKSIPKITVFRPPKKKKRNCENRVDTQGKYVLLWRRTHGGVANAGNRAAGRHPGEAIVRPVVKNARLMYAEPYMISVLAIVEREFGTGCGKSISGPFVSGTGFPKKGLDKSA